MVEKLGIPYRNKEILIITSLADDILTGYSNGMIRLKIEAIEFTINGITDKQRINIIDLGELDIFIGYNWLARYNPMIN